MCDKTGCSEEELAREVEALVVTLGAEGSRVHWRGETFAVPAVKADAVVDPTGCGDAYRAGLLHGIANGWDMRRSARLAAVMGAIKIAHRGGQNYKPSRAEIGSRHREAFGEDPW
jgi:adenosine kinase